MVGRGSGRPTHADDRSQSVVVSRFPSHRRPCPDTIGALRTQRGAGLLGGGVHVLEVSVSDPGELRSLREHLRRVPGVEIIQLPGTLADGELGAWDVLQVVAAGSGALAVAARTLPAFIRSRRSNVSVTVKTADRTVTITVDNVDDVMPVVEKVLDA
ncbi:hypothetical protein [Streptomyces sp. NPDC004658]|uniref:effector-associated constant component EACC1 n=1 Tax=Streptomyces sp. NPDC004658 TaxID=3154672 RepID=UPI0033B7EA54